MNELYILFLCFGVTFIIILISLIAVIIYAKNEIVYRIGNNRDLIIMRYKNHLNYERELLKHLLKIEEFMNR